MRKNPFGPDIPKSETPQNLADETQVTAKEHSMESNAQSFAISSGKKAIIYKTDFDQSVKDQIIQIETSLQNIKAITTQEEANGANAILKQAKGIIKLVEAAGKQMRAVISVAIDEIKAHETEVISDFQKKVEIVNQSITTFQKNEIEKARLKQEEINRKKAEELEAAERERKRISAIRENISEFQTSVMRAAAKATFADIDELIDRLAKYKLEESSYQEFIEEAKIMYQNCVVIFQDRKKELMQLESLKKQNAEKAAQLEAEQKKNAELAAQAQENRAEQERDKIADAHLNEVANIQMDSELKNAIAEPSIKGISKIWKFKTESVNMSVLPAEYHTFDSDKIKKAIKEGVREIPGVEIYQDIINVSR